MPSRCIFFFSALRAWSTLLSRTRTCTRRSFCCGPVRIVDEAEPADPPPKRDRAGSRLVAHVAESSERVHHYTRKTRHAPARTAFLDTTARGARHGGPPKG